LSNAHSPLPAVLVSALLEFDTSQAQSDILVWGDAAGVTVATRKNLLGPPSTYLSDLGSQALIFDEREVVRLLRAAIDREGNQGAFARRHGIERSHLNMVLNGKRHVSSNIAKALGLRRVYARSEDNEQ
jgi:hypothetical protein